MYIHTYIQLFKFFAFTKALQLIDHWFLFASKIFSLTSVNFYAVLHLPATQVHTSYAFVSLSYPNLVRVLFAYCIRKLAFTYINKYVCTNLRFFLLRVTMFHQVF